MKKFKMEFLCSIYDIAVQKSPLFQTISTSLLVFYNAWNNIKHSVMHLQSESVCTNKNQQF